MISYICKLLNLIKNNDTIIFIIIQLYIVTKQQQSILINSIFVFMIKASFGIKLFSDRDLLLTDNNELVHFENGNKRLDSSNALTNVYFYIKDDEICLEKDDFNYVTEVTELSIIPLYPGINPKYDCSDEDNKINELINQSNVCLFYISYTDDIKLVLHFLYKGEIFEHELNYRVSSLLKYTWFSFQDSTFEDFQKFGNNALERINCIDVNKIINDMKIISGEKTFYGRDSQSTDYAERWLIETDDLFILDTLFKISEKLYPRPFNDYTTYMYGSASSEIFNLFSYLHIEFINAKLKHLNNIIDEKTNEFNVNQCIKYIVLRNILSNEKYECRTNIRSIQGCKLDNFSFEDRKIINVKKEFFKNYNIGKHIAGLINIQSEAVKVPEKVMFNIMIGYKEWMLDKIMKSGLRYLTIYWGGKKLCPEFNKRSNENLNFRIDFSDFPNSRFDDTVNFDWDLYEY